MKKHGEKMIAPVVITCFFVLYFLAYAIGCFLTGSILFGVVGGLIAAGLMSVSIYVLVERIQEIRSGEEDDLSKY